MESEDTIFREWDLYDRIRAADYMKHEELASVVRAALSERTGPLRVLDLGCGDGWVARQVFADSHLELFVGVDLSEAALQRQSRLPAPGQDPTKVDRRLVLGDILTEMKRLPDRSFQVIHAGFSLHHYTRDAKPAVLDELARLLEPGGWFFWTDSIRLENESREQFLSRLGDDIQTNWKSLASDERETVTHHINHFDYPETESWMVEAMQQRGVALCSQLFRNPLYGALLFERST